MAWQATGDATRSAAAGGLAVPALLVRAWQSANGLEQATLVLAGVLYALGVYELEIPQERLHYLEYGLLSGLICFGLHKSGSRPWWHSALMATAITSALGLLDEQLQDWLWERRYFDWRDVILNARAAVLGVMVAVPLPQCCAAITVARSWGDCFQGPAAASRAREEPHARTWFLGQATVAASWLTARFRHPTEIRAQVRLQGDKPLSVSGGESEWAPPPPKGLRSLPVLPATTKG